MLSGAWAPFPRVIPQLCIQASLRETFVCGAASWARWCFPLSVSAALICLGLGCFVLLLLVTFAWNLQAVMA